MLDPGALIEYADDIPELDRPVLIQAMDGFVDAGSVRKLVREQLLAGSDAVLATFDVDQLIDYRSRRPFMIFERDHWSGYAEPRLAIHLLHDDMGTPFLLLEGPEPDYQWERFLAAVQLVVERFDVRLTIGLNAIPMAVPHTRPVGVIAHATSADLVADHPSWIDRVQVPGSAGNLLEYRLGQAGHEAVGFAVHVPHYLAQSEFPASAVALLESVTKAAGLVLPSGELRAAATRTAAEIDAQVAENVEVAEVVQALEQQYDSFVSGAGRSLLSQTPSEPLPSADELGEAFELFLAQQPSAENPDEADGTS
ncbi:MAG TPA: PAC2 family protein [Frankiaceae bacterium]|nr:PAC2 family protein [Frankiaceae bacterium]